MKDNQGNKPRTALTEIDSVKRPMEIDSGAAISAISEELYLDTFAKYKLITKESW